jgi:hypothetical protein
MAISGDRPLIAQDPSLKPFIDRGALSGRAYVLMDIAGLASRSIQLSESSPSTATALNYMYLFNTAAGVATIASAKQLYETASKTHHTAGKALASLSGVNGTFEIINGVTATAKVAIETTKASLVAASTLGSVAAGATGVRYLARFATGLMKFYHAASLYYRLSSHKTSLESEIAMKEADYQAAFKDYGKVKGAFSQSDAELICEEDREFVLSCNLDQAGMEKLYKEIANRRRGKLAQLREATSPEVVKALQNKEPDVLEKAKKACRSVALTNFSFIFLSIVGGAATVLDQVFTAGTIKYILYAVGLYISTHWLYLDMGIVKDAMKTNNPGKYDELFKWVLRIVVLAVSATAIIYTGGLPLIAIGIVCSILLLSAEIGICYKLKKARESLPKAEEKPQVDYRFLFEKSVDEPYREFPISPDFGEGSFSEYDPLLPKRS